MRYKKMYAFVIFVFLCVTMQRDVVHAKRILIISSIAQYSHQITYRGLAVGLHRRGHEIVSITPNPIKDSSLTNYTEIDLSYFYNGFPEYQDIINGTHPKFSFHEICLTLSYREIEKLIWSLIHVMNRNVFENPEVQKLFAANSGEHFDAVIVAQGPTVSLNAFAYRFNAPLIGISSLDVFNHMRYTFGSLILPSHISNWQQDNPPLGDSMSLWERLVNFYLTWSQIHYWMNVRAPLEDALARKYLGNDIPYIDDITRNMSVYLVNKHPFLSQNRPEQRNVIFYHGFHIAEVLSALPQDLKRFMDGAKDGFVYVSFGSGIDWRNMPNNVFAHFVEGLSTLPYRIVWKIDADLLPRKYKHIMASKWLPQQSILAHPNIKLFIYQGGLQSTEETVYYEVPVVGYPILWDQKFQVQNMVQWGVGIHLRHDTLSKQTIHAAVNEIIGNNRYKRRIMQLSRHYKDTPYDTLESAIQWVEYVMRQNGTLFLRDGLYNMPWYQRYDWDIIGLLAVAAFVAFLVSLYALFRALRFVCGYRIYNGLHCRNAKSKMQ